MAELIAFKSIFSHPFGYVNFGEKTRELNKRLISDINEEMSKSEGKTRTFCKNDCAWQSTLGMEKRYDSFNILRTLIDDASRPILEHSRMKPYNVRTENLWANKAFASGGYSAPHFHGGGTTLWTGVYYPKGIQQEENNLDEFNEDDYINLDHQKGDGLLILIDPSKALKGLVKGEYMTKEFYGSEITITPRESLLLLFPVWITHMVTPLTTNTDRYSISFGINKNK